MGLGLFMGFVCNLKNIKPIDKVLIQTQYLLKYNYYSKLKNKQNHKKHNSLLRLFGTHTAQPGSFGEDCSAFVAHLVIAHLTLAGENSQSSQRLLTSATTPLTVSSTATFRPFPLYVQQLCLQLPETKQYKTNLSCPLRNFFSGLVPINYFKYGNLLYFFASSPHHLLLLKLLMSEFLHFPVSLLSTLD